MIPGPEAKRRSAMLQPDILPAPKSWQSVLRDAVRSLDELAGLVGLPAGVLARGEEAVHQFPLLVPRGFVARMQRGDRNDPLLRQILPDARELVSAPGFDDDPLGESAFASDGVIRKYRGRALLVTTAACPVHCRYCFRRAFPYRDHKVDDWAGVLGRIAVEPGTTELILSGGDPLTLADRRLAGLLDAIVADGRFDTLRIHTRFPIMIPERITARLTALLAELPLATVVVVHANHPNEIDAEVAAALESLGASVATLLNQSVLLAGINDDVATLAALSRRLWRSGVLPYYLHALDRVTGAAHFAVDDARAVALADALRAELPGYLVPRLVREVPGELSKTLLL